MTTNFHDSQVKKNIVTCVNLIAPRGQKDRNGVPILYRGE